MSADALAQSSPNIVYILADDMGIGDVSAYNDTAIVPRKNGNPLTRNIDSMANAGMRFTNAHSPSAVCSPSRYGLLTGQYPFRVNREVGVQFNYGDVYVAEGRRTVAQMLDAQGYATGFVGKWHLGYDVFDANGRTMSGSERNPDNQPDWTRGIANGPKDRGGYDETFGHVASADIPPYKFFRNNQWVNENAVFIGPTDANPDFDIADYYEQVWANETPAYPYEIDRLGNGFVDGTPGHPDPNHPDHLGNATVDWDPRTVNRTHLQEEAVKYIEHKAGGSQPFYLQLSLSSPHTPTTPHPDMVGTTGFDANDQFAYTDFVAEVDEIVGAVTQALNDQGVLGETLVILTSDNGADDRFSEQSVPLEQHRSTGVLDGIELRGRKATVYEGGNRVPFIARWGDGTEAGSQIAPGTVNGEMTDLTDFYATVAALTGAELAQDEAPDSFNMLPALTGDGTSQNIRTSMISNSRDGAFIVRHVDESNDEWKLIYTKGSDGPGLDPDDDIADYGQFQLYNLTSDLDESDNLLAGGGDASARAKADELHALLQNAIYSGRSTPGLPAAVNRYKAEVDTDGDSTLDDHSGYVDMRFAAAMNSDGNITPTSAVRTPAAGSRYFSTAYAFNGTDQPIGGGLRNNADFLEQLASDGNGADAAFEVWFRPDDFSGNQILFEMGGATKGFSMTLTGDTVTVLAKDEGGDGDTPTVDLSTESLTELGTDEFIQALVTIDQSASDADGIEDDFALSIYINGKLAATQELLDDTLDYGGGNGAGIANRFGRFDQPVGGSQRADGRGDDFGAFVGEMALFRIYGRSLSGDEVLAIYNGVVPEPATLLLVAFGLPFVAHRPRRDRRDSEARPSLRNRAPLNQGPTQYTGV